MIATSLSCGAPASAVEPRTSGRAAGTELQAQPPTSTTIAVPEYRAVVDDIAAAREALARELAAASTPEGRASVLTRARARLERAIVDELTPRWMGTPWAMNGVSTEPGEGAIACGYFVATILQDAGFRLRRVRFGQAAALRIQEATTPPRRAVHRFLSIPPEALAERVAALGDGVYIIGLNVHVGFVVVRGGDVRFVHSSYTGARVVVDEPLATARAIELSQPSGYFVSELISTDEAITRWLGGAALSLP